MFGFCFGGVKIMNFLNVWNVYEWVIVILELKIMLGKYGRICRILLF